MIQNKFRPRGDHGASPAVNARGEGPRQGRWWTTPRDRVAVIATDPLTRNEAWTPLAPGQLAVFRDGALVQAP